jgi:hypothetical protein
LAGDLGAAEKRDRKRVWMIFFSSYDCPKCESVKELIDVLKLRYPLSVKQLDITKEADYSIFKAVESIHGSGNFAVPLAMLGNSILIGQEDINRKLENTVRELAAKGGASPPYIGPVESQLKAQNGRRANSNCESCSRGRRPPEVGDELHRARELLEKLF